AAPSPLHYKDVGVAGPKKKDPRGLFFIRWADLKVSHAGARGAAGRGLRDAGGGGARPARLGPRAARGGQQGAGVPPLRRPRGAARRHGRARPRRDAGGARAARGGLPQPPRAAGRACADAAISPRAARAGGGASRHALLALGGRAGAPPRGAARRARGGLRGADGARGRGDGRHARRPRFRGARDGDPRALARPHGAPRGGPRRGLRRRGGPARRGGRRPGRPSACAVMPLRGVASGMAPKPPAKPPLTPSETVYFHAPDFARDAVTPDAVEVAASDEKVRATDLAVTLLAAAILADERAGALRLEPGERKDALFLRPAQGSVFPAGSPEAKVREAAAKVATPDVESVVRAYLAKDADKPFEAVVG